MLPCAPHLPSRRSRALVGAFRSPATVASLNASIPGSTLPASYFAACIEWFFARSAFQLHPQPPVRPGLGGLRRFGPVAFLPSDAASWLPLPPLPIRGFTPVRIKAFSSFRRRSTHLPTTPDSRSLPAAPCFFKSVLRINVPESLRFRRLAVPQTSWNLPHYRAHDRFLSNRK